MARNAVWKVAGFVLICGLPTNLWGQTPAPGSLPNAEGNLGNLAEIPESSLLWEDAFPLLRPRGGISHQTGEGIGYQHSFTTLNGWIPFLQTEMSTAYVSANGQLFNDSVMGSSVGGGYRWVSAEGNRLYGINAFYDYRNTGRANFHQFGAGLETLGETWDGRLNFYLPNNTKRMVQEDRSAPTLASVEESCTPLGYQGNFLLLQKLRQENYVQQRIRQFEAAMCGFDVEVGPRLPFLPEYLRGYVGMYHYQAQETPQVWGAKGRLELNLTENVALNLTVSHDRLFDTTVMFNAAFVFPSFRFRRLGRDFAPNRLDEPVERSRTIVVAQSQIQDQVAAGSRTTREVEVARDPATNTPYLFRHADSKAPVGGDGTYERPFNTLSQLQAGSLVGDILLVHAGSEFQSESITLQDNQRFLGDGANCRHNLDVLGCGTIVLPRANNLAAQPIIRDASTAVTLANGNEVSGFQIINPGIGISGTGINNFNINCNRIVQAALGIDLVDVGGRGLIFDNYIEGNFDDECIFINNSSSSRTLQLAIHDNEILNTDSKGINIQNGNTAILNARIFNNVIRTTTEQGIIILGSNSSSTTAIITGNTLSDINFSAIVLGIFDTADFLARVENNRLGIPGDPISGTGVRIANNSSSNNLVFGVLSNTINTTGFLGALISSSDGTFCLRFLNNSSNVDYYLFQFGGTFNAEAGFLSQVTGTVNTSGTINTVPAGSCPVP